MKSIVVAIIPTWKKPVTLGLAKELLPMLRQLGIEPVIEDGFEEEIKIKTISQTEKIDYFLVLGGDGTFIAEARKYFDRGIPFIGMNAGHLGYLADCTVSSALRDFKHIVQEKIKLERRIVLECQTPSQETLYAINDIVLHRGQNPGIIETSVYSGEEFICDYLADGLIVATPNGSTAYSLSAGGPIIDPKANAIVLTAICPQSLSYRPIVLNSDTILEIQYLTNGQPALLSIDGQVNRDILPLQKVTVKVAIKALIMVRFEGKSYWQTMVYKLGIKNNSRADRL